MLYLTAGLAWAHIEVTSICSIVPTANVSNCAPGNYFGGTLGPDAITRSAIRIGWTAGAGVEMLLGAQLDRSGTVSLRQFRVSFLRSFQALQLYGYANLQRLPGREYAADRLL